MHIMIIKVIARPNPMTIPIIREIVSKFSVISCSVGTTNGCVVDGHICCIIKVIDSLFSKSIKVKELL